MGTPPRVDFSKLPGQVSAVIDYLVVVDDGRDRAAGEEPAGGKGPLDVGHGVVLRQLDFEMGERVLTASLKRGENFDAPMLYRAAYAFTRAATREEFEPNLYGWDPTGVLFDTLWLSRLVHDNAATTEYAVRRIVRNDAKDRLVPFDAYDLHVAYKVDPTKRDWLVEEDLWSSPASVDRG